MNPPSKRLAAEHRNMRRKRVLCASPRRVGNRKRQLTVFEKIPAGLLSAYRWDSALCTKASAVNIHRPSLFTTSPVGHRFNGVLALISSINNGEIDNGACACWRGRTETLIPVQSAAGLCRSAIQQNLGAVSDRRVSIH